VRFPGAISDLFVRLLVDYGGFLWIFSRFWLTFGGFLADFVDFAVVLGGFWVDFGWMLVLEKKFEDFQCSKTHVRC
jgi:hypothetical protein